MSYGKTRSLDETNIMHLRDVLRNKTTVRVLRTACRLDVAPRVITPTDAGLRSRK